MMSVLYTSTTGWLLSHEDYINDMYKYVKDNGNCHSFKVCKELFKIITPFKKLKGKNRKRKLNTTFKEDSDANTEVDITQEEVNYVSEQYLIFQKEIRNFLTAHVILENADSRNDEAQNISKKIYDESGICRVTNLFGENSGDAKIVSINENKFLFPNNCKFFCKDVVDIERHLVDVKYDIIVLDPPWWNKYVRRKKAKTDHGYKMMYNDDLQCIPVEKLLDDNGIVVVWCTNSSQNLRALKNLIFAKWNVNLIAKWYWLKVTQSGETICDFSIPPNKQPFEQLLIGSRNSHHDLKSTNGKLIVSVPSALHSNKPPLVELFKQYLPKNPNCLEIFARYLLPNWTSWGNEVLRFQHECLYQCEE